MTTDILGHVNASLQDRGVNDYADGYEAGKKAGKTIAPGERFLGGMGYADLHCGSNKACRDSMAWKGRCAGYLDGLPECRSITVDANGIVVSINP